MRRKHFRELVHRAKHADVLDADAELGRVVVQTAHSDVSAPRKTDFAQDHTRRGAGANKNCPLTRGNIFAHRFRQGSGEQTHTSQQPRRQESL